MRVLYDHAIFVAQRYGGISRYFSELIPRIAVRPDFTVCLFMGFYVNGYRLPAQRDLFERFWGVRRPFVRKTHRIAQSLSNALLDRIVPAWMADLYHTTDFEVRFESFAGKRIITVQDLTSERLPQLFPGHEHIHAVKQAALARADGIICCSECTRRDLLSVFQVPKAKVRVIHHANSLTLLPRPKSVIPEPYLLYVGDRWAYKNFRALLEAFAESRDIAASFRLVCFGGGPLASRDLELLRERGLSQRVQSVAGDDQTLANLYAHATLFIYPSLYEGFGIPLLEALHYGCPVLASRSSAIPEVLGDAGLYFDPQVPGDLGRQLAALLTNDSLRARLKETGPRQEARFSWERCARETAAFYAEVAGG